MREKYGEYTGEEAGEKLERKVKERWTEWAADKVSNGVSILCLQSSDEDVII
jgi:hypothetical protein